MKQSSPNTNITWRITGLLLFFTLLTLSPIVNKPECPSGYSQAQVDASGCIIGANIGMALLFTYMVLPLSIVTIILWGLKLWSYVRGKPAKKA